ncbi:unnamed protein product [Symbiodinium natans]|uniref:Uncharacterized protein n=1 Tax=Symbiodinium natans TaxID=878477 RepID=A0A812PA63_9DINO|nr:unnamed protein product [Symbiodinium natans]
MITFRILLCRFYDVADEDLDDALKGVVITVDLADNLSVMKTIRGRHCLLHDKRMAVPMDLFLEAVKVSFKFSLFVVGGQAVKQLRGAPMGSHFSPAACHAVVSLYEHMYFSHCLLNSVRLPTYGLVVRYVDNRLSLIFDRHRNVAADVCVPPIVLEYEEGNLFLGFHVDLQQLRIKYVQPVETWKFLHPLSAANSRTLLSSFRSRAHLVARASWPKTQCDDDLNQLVQSYVKQGFDPKMMEVNCALTPPEQLPAWARPDEGRRRASPPPLRRTPGLPYASERSDAMVPLPRAPPPTPPTPFLTLTEGYNTIQVHDEAMANRLIERLALPHRQDNRSRSPVLRSCPPLPRRRPAVRDEPSTSIQLLVSNASADAYVVPDGPEIPPPSDEWTCIKPSAGSELWVKFMDTSMLNDRPDVQHMMWPQFFCIKTMAGMHLYGFHPTENTKDNKKQWHDFERLLLHFRSALMRDPNRIKSAAELNGYDCPVLNAGTYWLFPSETDPTAGASASGDHEAPVGVFLVLTTDLSSIISQRVVRPSYYDRADRKWLLSSGFYGRMAWPPSAIRQPKLDGSMPDHLAAMCASMVNARRFGGKQSDTRTCAAVGWTFVRQHVHSKAAFASDQTFGHMYDLVHGQDGRWMFRSSRSILTGAAVFWTSWAIEDYIDVLRSSWLGCLPL